MMSLIDKTKDNASSQTLSEPENVLWNRFGRFKELLPEIDEECIKELAAATKEVYPSDMEKLLEAGCPPELAVKILKPL